MAETVGEIHTRSKGYDSSDRPVFHRSAARCLRNVNSGVGVVSVFVFGM